MATNELCVHLGPTRGGGYLPNGTPWAQYIIKANSTIPLHCGGYDLISFLLERESGGGGEREREKWVRDRIETEVEILPHNHTSQETAILELKLLLSYERDRDRERKREWEWETERQRRQWVYYQLLLYKVRKTSLVKHCIWQTNPLEHSTCTCAHTP